MLFSDKRFFGATLVPMVVFGAIILRLFYLQVIRGEVYLARSQSNFIQERPISHSRGLILDQTGRTLADNRSAHDVYVTFALLPDARKVLTQINPWLKLDNKALRVLDKQILSAQANNDANPIALATLNKPKTCEQFRIFLEDDPIQGLYLQNSDETCRIHVVATEFSSKKAALVKLGELLDLEADEFDVVLNAAFKKADGLGQYKPVLFLSDISFEAYARVASVVSLGALPGVAIFDSVKRRYINAKMASHVLGYVNEISAEEIKRRQSNYRPGQRVGRKGLELVYEKDLRGEDGVERYVVDAKGRRFGPEWESLLLSKGRVDDPVPGNTIKLSLDADLQEAAERTFTGQAGSVVALEVGTGYVLALASFPNYDGNEIIGRHNRKLLQSMLKDPLKPWINKAVQEHYAPGSTFKAVTAVAGFEHRILTPQTRHNCTGTFHLGRASWRCFKREGHGNIEVVSALKTSCDMFFYTVGYDLGPDRLAQTARLLGFGRKTGIDIDTEIPGIIPDRAYYQKRLGYYAPGFVINSSIGQGDVTTTPIQLAVAYDAILNGGTIYKPQLVREVLDPSGQKIGEHLPKVVAQLTESEANLKLVKEGLAYVMQPGGTAYGLQYRQDLPDLAKWLRESGVTIGGKTGTAQVVRLSKSIKHLDPTKVAYAERDHAWFVGFAPLEKPEIVIVAMTEHGGFGGSASAPVVAEMVKVWYEKVRGRGRYAP